MIKSSIIYKTKKFYKIVTESESDTGLLISSEPVFILPIDSDITLLKDKIFESLNSSQSNLKMPESREKWKEWQNKQLYNLKERSFINLYKKSVSCQVKIEKGALGIYPYKFLPKQGLVTIEERVTKLKAENINKIKVTNYIVDELKKMEVEK